LSITSYAPLTEPFAPMMQAMPKVPAPRAYLDGLDPDLEATGHHYADMLEAKILAEGPDSVLAFIVEPIGGASTGALVPPRGYMERVQEICRKYGVLFILDEVMTGAGRTGKFLAAEHWDLAPDIIVMSKGFAAGYVPLGAMVAHERLVEAVLDAGGFLHGFTYAGNPLACAAGLAVIDEIERQDLVGNAATMGARLKDRLHGLMQRHEISRRRAWHGPLTAFEFMADRSTKAPLPKHLRAFDRFVQIAYETGLIVYSRRTRDGVEGDHIIVAPPMIVTERHLDEITDMLDASLTAFTTEIRPAMRRAM